MPTVFRASYELFFPIVLWVALFLTIGVPSYSQEEQEYSAITHYGFIWSHTPKMQHLATGHFPGFEFSYSRRPDGSKLWHQYYGFPSLGISVFGSDVHNKPTFGYAAGIYPHIRFLLAGRKNELLFRVGAGLGYVHKPWERTENYKQIAIGSKLNVLIHFMAHYKMRISDQWHISSGISLMHFSNGSTKMPNLGINMPMLHCGIHYKPYGSRVSAKELTDLDEKWVSDRVSLLMIGSACEMYPANGPLYAVYGISAEYAHAFSRFHAAGISTDFFYDRSIKPYLMRNPENGIPTEWFTIRPGIGFFYQMRFDRIYFIINNGMYLHNPDKSEGNIYNRITLRYQTKKRYFFHFGLKSHFGKADFIECGVGINIWKK
jgi:hypothetical protein